LRFWTFIALVSILIALAIWYALSLDLSARLCKMGFETGPNYTCIDRDECDYGESVCGGSDNVCVNTIGSFVCHCKNGYLDVNGDGTTCRDIDECRIADPCSASYASCFNVPGSFECKCTTGYVMSKKSCVDINECNDATDMCDLNAQCINTPGSYRCKCNEPMFFGDGRNCDYIDGCWNEPCGVKHQCRPDTSLAGHFTCQCELPFINRENGCHCAIGYVEKHETCHDIDECDNARPRG